MVMMGAGAQRKLWSEQSDGQFLIDGGSERRDFQPVLYFLSEDGLQTTDNISAPEILLVLTGELSFAA